MSVLDAAILFGKETTYGTPAALTRGYEGKADGWKREQDYLESVGFRAAMHTARTDRRKPVNMGAAGELEVDWLDKGMGLLAQAMFGTTTGPTQVGATTAYTQAHTTATDEPAVSYTVQVLRPKVGGGTTSFTYHGAVVTGWTLTQEVGGLLVAKVEFDAEDEDTTTPAGSPVYPSDTRPLDWTGCVVSLGGVAVDAKSVEVKAELGLKTDRRYLRGNPLKKTPKRAAVPTYEGKVDLDFDDLTRYANYVNGDLLALSVVWTGRQIETGQNYTLTLDAPAIQLTGDSPQAALDDLTAQGLPFRILHNGTHPAMTLTIKSTDSAL